MTEFSLDFQAHSADVDKAAEIASVLKVLADPTRLRILLFLAENREKKCVCELQAMFDLGQPTISHHLKQLKEHQLVTSDRKGTWIEYQITNQGLHVYETVLQFYR
jgi:ArsR family transcriptional regulator